MLGQQIATHVFGKAHQSIALSRRGLFIDQDHRLGWIWTAEGIAQRGLSFNGSHHGESIELLSVPVPILHMPGECRLIADQAYFAVGKTLGYVNIGAAALNVITSNLLGRAGSNQGQ